MSAEQLKPIIAATLSPQAEERRNAEKQLNAAQATAGHPLQVLRIIAEDGSVDPAIRQAAAVHFKNTIKKGWDDEEAIAISVADRTTIKSHLVQLMCTTPPQIQAQLSESISLIAAADYPQQWENLLPELVAQFQSPDMNVVVGVLKTANSIFKSFRYVERSDALYAVIKYTLEGVQAPLLALFKQLGQAVEALASDANQLRPRMEALRLINRIFYSLNYQDLPEFFEDHMEEWMSDFGKYLQYKNPVLEDEDEETEPSPIDKLQTAIIANLALYADKDEEPFLPYLPNFTTLVWNLLMNVSNKTKHDALAVGSIRFLASLLAKSMHRNLFQEQSILEQIVVKIVIPNLYFRESDEERFEDDPREYIVTEVEGSDSETRRKCSQDLLRAMCRQFELETTAICGGHVATMLNDYAKDPNGQWRAKDAAVHLMMGIAIRKESLRGVSEVNSGVNVMDFFQSHILPELKDMNHTSRPVLKATAIKYVSSFRNQFTREQLTSLMPLLIGHLSSPVVVVHTFSAYAIERLLFAKQDGAGRGHQPKIGAEQLKPFLEPLFRSLFGIIENAQLDDNEYAMKCVMRSLATAGEDVIPVTQEVITKLTSTLVRVSKHPRNPQYNHNLFESIAVLIRSVCSKDPNMTASFEPLLFEPFTHILQTETAPEFTPYVFQVLAQLLEYRPVGSGLGQAYSSLFQPILTPDVWNERGNVPALARLLQAYIKKAPTEIVGHIMGILGVFQKLVASTVTEDSAFGILTSAIVFFPKEAMEPNIATIFQILLTRLQAAKKQRYKSLVTTFFALFTGKYGAQAFVDCINAIQPGLALMLLQQVWIPRMQTEPPVERTEAKTHVIGLTKLLTETSALLSDDNGRSIWARLLASVVVILTSPTFQAAAKTGAIDDGEEEMVSYENKFSKLKYAGKPAEDYFPEVPDPTATFVQSLHRLLSQQPGALTPLVQQGLSVDPKLAAGLETMFKQAGLQLA